MAKRDEVLAVMKDDPRPKFGWGVKDIEGETGIKKASRVLNRMRERGELKRIRRGRYTLMPVTETNKPKHPPRRRVAKKKRTPHECLPFICQHCGCPFPTKYRRRNHIRSDHYNTGETPNVTERVLKFIKDNDTPNNRYWSTGDISAELNIESYNVRMALCNLVRAGELERVAYGEYVRKV